MKQAEQILEFDIIKARLAEHALSAPTQARLLSLRPLMSESECRARMAETTGARAILDSLGTPPLSAMRGLAELLELCEKGSLLSPEQLEAVASFWNSCRQLIQYLKRAEAADGEISSYRRTFCDLSELYEEIDRAIRNGRVDDAASPALRAVRRKLESTRSAVKAKLESLLQSKRGWFSDSYVAVRNGHFTLPVKREYKNQMNGRVIETSATGGTCFMEPAAVSKLQEELTALEIEEDGEIRRVLYTLTGMVEEQLPQLRLNAEAMEALDFLFAKAKYSAALHAVPARLTAERKIELRGGRHPLLEQQECIPLDFTLGGETRGVIITGPNTGGKTVALKTVGLLSMMAQCGLHIPAAADSLLALNGDYLCDIGDGQSISENLSTFSAHMTNIISILEQARPDSLVLLDELGSGTDPAEGMGIAVSVLEELRARGCLFLATTHYPNVKAYAEEAGGLANARMAFDRENLRPLYRLEQGEAGESCALYIAERLGFPAKLLELARREAYRQPQSTPAANQQPASPAEPRPKMPPRIRPAPAPATAAAERAARFQRGDSVTLSPSGEIGIVFRPAGDKGEVGVQIKGEKRIVPHKRLTLLVSASELYPPDYDFSIVFDSVENRKSSRKMEKGHHPELSVTHEALE